MLANHTLFKWTVQNLELLEKKKKKRKIRANLWADVKGDAVENVSNFMKKFRDGKKRISVESKSTLLEEVKWLQKYRTCWATEKQFFLKRQKQFSGKSKKLWDLLFMDASTLTSEHQPKLKLVLCVWTQDCAQGLG